MTIEWRASMKKKNTFLDDACPAQSGVMWRTLYGKWAWAVRDMTAEPMVILAKGEHRNRIKSAQQYEQAKKEIAARRA